MEITILNSGDENWQEKLMFAVPSRCAALRSALALGSTMGRSPVAASTPSISGWLASRFMRSTQRMTSTRWAFQAGSMPSPGVRPMAAASLAVGASALDVGAGPELRSLVERFGCPEGPGAGGDRHGQGLEVAERSPLRAAEAKAANLVSCVDAHGFLPFGRSAVMRVLLPRRRARFTRAGLRLSAPRGAAWGEEELGACGGRRAKAGNRALRSDGRSGATVEADAVAGVECGGGGLDRNAGQL